MPTSRHFRRIIVLGLPLMAGMISEFAMYLADSAMVGRLSVSHLAAIGIATMMGELLWVIVWPLAPGTQTLASRRFGRQEAALLVEPDSLDHLRQRTGEVLENAVVVSMAIGTAAVCLGFLSRPALSFLLDEVILVELADSYIQIVKWAMIPAALYYTLYGFLAAVNLTRPIMVASVSLNLLNIILNYGFIFGNLGFPALGIRGAALGTLLAQVAGSAILLGYVLLSQTTRPYRCLRFKKLTPRLMKDVSIAAAPMIAQLSIAFVFFLYFESIVAGIGTLHLAVTHILFTAFVLNRSLVGGFAEGSSILVGNCLGRGDKEEAVRYAWASLGIAAVLGASQVCLLVALPEQVVRVFNSEPETVAMGVDALLFFSVFYFTNALAYPLEIIFTHNGWGRFVLMSETGCILVFTLGLTLLLVRYFGLGIYAAWLSFGLYATVFAGCLIWGFLSKRWLEVNVESE